MEDAKAPGRVAEDMEADDDEEEAEEEVWGGGELERVPAPLT